VIREAVSEHLGTRGERMLNLPLFPEGLGEDIASRVDELLEGSGEEW